MKYYLIAVVLVTSICSTYGDASFTFPSKVYAMAHDTDAYMQCKVTSNFIGFYYEKDLTKKLETGGRISIDFDNGAHILEIRKLTEEDYGKYYCNDTESGDVATLVLTLTVPELRPQQNLALGHQGIVRAEVYAMPKVPILWSLLRDGEPALKLARMNEDGTQQDIPGSERYEVTQRGSLIIKKVEESDAGKYQLTGFTNVNKVTRTTIVQVGSKPSLSASPNKFYIVTKGLDLKIPCEWVGASDKQTWTFVVEKGVATEITDGIDSTGLTLLDVQPTAVGNYTCKSSNEFGNSSITTNLKQVIIPPEITSAFTNESLVEGTSFNLSCKASGIPAPAIRIFKTAGNNLAVGTGMAVKTFTSLDTADKGKYTCHADNGAQAADRQALFSEKKMHLEILTPPVIDASETMTTKKITSAVGLSFIVHCTSRGNPNPTVKLMKNGVDITANTTMQYGAVTASFQVKSALKENFGRIDCIAVNDHGETNVSINVMEVVKALAPSGLSVLKDVGLEYIDLTWKVVDDADSYIVYVNETREQKSTENTITISSLKRSTYYSFKVASVNLAGVGNASTPVNFKTSDITVPSQVTGFDVQEASSDEMEVTWNAPSNVDDSDVILYEVTYCETNNVTVKNCQKKKSKDTRVDLVNLKPNTNYQVEIKPSNQGVEGEVSKFTVQTQPEPTVEPVPSGKESGGLGSGAVVGIIIVVILIILIVVDMFCCYFNHCGFTHCCFETFCTSSKKAKYGAADLNEDAEELKPKAQSV